MEIKEGCLEMVSGKGRQVGYRGRGISHPGFIRPSHRSVRKVGQPFQISTSGEETEARRLVWVPGPPSSLEPEAADLEGLLGIGSGLQSWWALINLHSSPAGERRTSPHFPRHSRLGKVTGGGKIETPA